MTAAEGQLELVLGPLFVVEVAERVSTPLTGQSGRAYTSPPQPLEGARQLAALLLDRPDVPDGEGPWHRPLAGGQRTVRLVRAEPQPLGG